MKLFEDISCFVRYLWTVIFHKLMVFIAGVRINIRLNGTGYQVSYKRLLLHDMSKFSIAEFWPYAIHFCGKAKEKETFHKAWLHHVASNDHHWEHFIPNYSDISNQLWNEPQLAQPPKEIPDDALMEMIADNIGATRSYEGHWPTKYKWTWLTNYYDKYILHLHSRIKMSALLCALGYADVLPSPFDWDSINILPDRNTVNRLRLLAKKDE
ncbi:unnamed protein product [Didymodactylos carnosus]|uniref:Uncharacterized protein n=1 Tax=Didymodactylos carnosus TaxID=1234261 RepID=A0A814EAL2_9BILA|nr:unnamed protein product [Didymodactylos carnosus]CAF0966912.1 unnamed protein product [Didymodactylos carnosus]CAF3672236.1 unnamed protein product [Didymodactylos carnosus]CAF3740400.1 unnamed protein product [Didymodactylos carnosus]